VTIVVLLTVASPARADVKPLQWDPVVDGAVTGSLLLAYGLTELPFKSALAPDACLWCDSTPVDDAVRAIFIGTSHTPSLSGNGGFDLVSNATTYALAPLFALGTTAAFTHLAGARWEDALGDVVVIAQASLVTALLTQAVKFGVGRVRPFVSDFAPADRANTEKPNDNFLSFFSGHAAFTTAVVVATATVQTLRGFDLAWLTWVTGVPLALAGGVLRLAADKHWFTDVAVGTFVGAALGAAIPLLHGVRRSGADVSVSAGPGGVALSGRF